MATIIDPIDFNRYEVVQVKNFDSVPLITTTDPGTGTKPASLDAFGRQRVSNPLTLFDSSHRYSDNNLWATDTTSGGAATFNANQGLVDLIIPVTSGARVYRETFKVFSYQPGKSLLVMTTFTFNPAKDNLRQRVGYFGDDNGLFVQLNNNILSFVERSSVTGVKIDTTVTQANWNTDRMDGTGPSGVTLDPATAQILWMDIEWLGLGTVRMGFIIDGKFIICHQFHHANLIIGTYITTASLPLRYEIENTGTTATSSTLKQICSTVLSEGGYEMRGAQQGIGTPIDTPYDLTLADTYYPIIALKLRTSPNRLDAVVVITALSFLGITNNSHYNWRLVAGGTTAAGTWFSAGASSSVQYNLTGTSFSGGRTLAEGFSTSSNQSTASVNIFREALFKFQLERNSFTSIPFEITLIAASQATNSDLYASMDWEEISR